MIEFNINSPQHISVLLFGGELLEDIKIENGVFKGGKAPGQIKYKKIKQKINIRGLKINSKNSEETKTKNIFKTDEETLNNLIKKFKENDVQLLKYKDQIDILTVILTIRALQKEVSTYYENIYKYIYNNNFVHANFTHVKTSTGRLNCSSPNLQNQPKPPSKISKHFTSRFLEGNLLLTDYSQIDVRCEAQQCGDKQRKKDIQSGIDDHTMYLSFMVNKPYAELIEKVKTDPYWKNQRSIAKGFTFAGQYLASPATIARNINITESLATKVMDDRKNLYSTLYEWHTKNYEQIKKCGYYNTLTGRILRFKKYSGQYGEYYSPNEASNYCTQSLAGDIVGGMLGIFWRKKAIYNRDKYLLINTVHDNYIFDVKTVYIETLKEDLKVVDTWKEVCYDKFNYLWDIDILRDTCIGNSWYECLE